MVFGLFGNYYQINDSYKESDPSGENRGFLQRYHELLGSEIDENLVPKISEFLQKAVQPQTILDNIVGLVEQSFGLRTNLYDSIELRKKLIQYLPKCNRNRGKFVNYVFLLGLLGFDVSINQNFSSGIFDDGTFDGGFLDGTLSNFVSYTLTLTFREAQIVTGEIESQVARIVEYNHPIHARLPVIVYANTTPNTIDFDESDFNEADFK